jgi:hypothetical protein
MQTPEYWYVSKSGKVRCDFSSLNPLLMYKINAREAEGFVV